MLLSTAGGVRHAGPRLSPGNTERLAAILASLPTTAAGRPSELSRHPFGDVRRNAGAVEHFVREAGGEGEVGLFAVEAVSYTHLDVYKRQR